MREPLNLTRLLREQPPRETSPRIRMSGLGKCDRALAYIHHGAPEDGRVIDARAERVFRFGDAVEELLVDELRRVLPEGWILRDVLGEQMTVRLTLGSVEVVGHPDGLLIGPDCSAYLLEVKSASSYGFRRMEEHGLDPSESYYHQHQAYLHAADVDGGVFLVMAKDSAAVTHFWTQRDPNWLASAEARLARITSSASPEDVPRLLPDGTELAPRVDLHKTRGTPNKRHGELPWQCRYCSYYRTCWPGVEERVVTDYRGTPSLGLYYRPEGEP